MRYNIYYDTIIFFDSIYYMLYFVCIYDISYIVYIIWCMACILYHILYTLYYISYIIFYILYPNTRWLCVILYSLYIIYSWFCILYSRLHVYMICIWFFISFFKGTVFWEEVMKHDGMDSQDYLVEKIREKPFVKAAGHHFHHQLFVGWQNLGRTFFFY